MLKTIPMYVILRSYNNPKILDQIKSLATSNCATSIFVVINSREDRLNTGKLVKSYKTSVPIFILPLKNYGWSKAINFGLINLPKKTAKNELVMIISNEVIINIDNINELQTAALKDDSSCGYALFKNRKESTYLLPRNTCIIWKRNIFEKIELFNEKLDNKGGMEDYEMILRAYMEKKLLPYLGTKSAIFNIRTIVDFNKKIEIESESKSEIEKYFPKEVVKSVREHIEFQNTHF